MYAQGLDATRKDSRDLITTNDKYTKAGVNYKVTNSQLEYYFAKATQKITVLLELRFIPSGAHFIN